MERARHRKSKSASGMEGARRIQKNRVVAGLSWGSLSNTDGRTRDNMFMQEMGQSSSGRATRSPVAKLLAERMYKEIESKRRSQSVISRFMGLEGLSSLLHIHRKREKLSESYKKQNPYDDRSYRRSLKEQQEYNDVYDDLEASHSANRRCSSRWSASSMITKSDMALIQHRIRDARRCSVDEEKQDNLFVNHLHNDCKDGLLLEPQNHRRAHISHRRPSMIQSEEMNEENVLPTRIVVLHASPDCSRGYVPKLRSIEESPSVGDMERVSWRRNNAGPISREVKEIAGAITRRMRGQYDETVDAVSSLRGYAGDESSYDAQESDFPDIELENIKLSSRNSFGDDNKLGRYPSCGSVERPFNREAKKRLSERWKVTNKYRDLEIISSRGNTLGEMLALPVGEVRSKHYYPNRSLDRESPLGSSSRDGLKYDINRTSSRSSSVPPSIGRRSHRGSTYYDTSKVAECKNLCHKESQDSKSRSKKPLPCQHIHNFDIDCSSAAANFEIQMEANVKDVSKQHFMLKMPTKDDSNGGPVVDITVAENGSTSSLLHQKQVSFVDNDKALTQDQEDFCLQELHKAPCEKDCPAFEDLLGAQLASSESSKELDHASPVLVFEVAFVEDTSSCSESFEKLCAELNELSMQLQLLKMESCTHGDVSLEDIAQLSSVLLEAHYILGSGEGWEVNYALDVLIHSGLQDSSLDMSRIIWHSPNCPLNPELFYKLEKKYSDGMTGSRPERRLLFDRINSALMEISQQHVDSYPWVMPNSVALQLTSQKYRVRNALEKLINLESGTRKAPERALDKDMQWADTRGEINLIGNDIEEVLVDEMMEEFLFE